MKNIIIVSLSIYMVLAFVGCTEDTPNKGQAGTNLTKNGIIPIQKYDSNNDSLKGDANFASQFQLLLQGLKDKDVDVINKFISPELGLYYVAPMEGAYSDYYKYSNIDTLFAESKARPGAFVPFNQFMDYLETVDLSEYKLQFEVFGENDISCDFNKIGAYADKEIIPSYEALSDIYTNLEDLEVVSRQEDANKEWNALKNAEKSISRRIVFGLSGNEEIYSELLYFSFVNGNWYLSVLDFEDCGL